MVNKQRVALEALRVLDLNGIPDGTIAGKLGVSERTIRRARSRARAAHGARWPNVPAIVDETAVADPGRDAERRREKAGKARDAREDMPEHPIGILEPPPETATPDELEAFGVRALVAEARMPGKERVSAAKALIEIARERRGRPPTPNENRTPEQIADEVARAIELATDNVEPKLPPDPTPND